MKRGATCPFAVLRLPSLALAEVADQRLSEVHSREPKIDERFVTGFQLFKVIK